MPSKAMTKAQLVDTLATRSGSDKKSAKAVLEGLTALVTETLKKGGEIKLQDLGKFKVVNRKARVGRNPQTGEPIKIPAKKAVKFYLAKSLKDIARK